MEEEALDAQVALLTVRARTGFLERSLLLVYGITCATKHIDFVQDSVDRLGLWPFR